MLNRTANSRPVANAVFAAALLFMPGLLSAQNTANPDKAAQTSDSKSADRWLHVRVISTEAKGETVRINIPVELAEKVLPTINKDRLKDGKVRIDEACTHDVDLRNMLDALRTTKDGEFVTVQSDDSDVRVAKKEGHLIVHVLNKKTVNDKKAQVEIKIPMKVIDALFSAGKDELDLVAALHALSAQGDTELVSVKDTENTVRVWLDSKNVTD